MVRNFTTGELTNLPSDQASSLQASVAKIPPGMPYIAGNPKANLNQSRNNEMGMKNFSANKAGQVKKVYLKPKVARLYNSTSPKKSRTQSQS